MSAACLTRPRRHKAMSNEELVRLAQRNDTTANEELISRCTSLVQSQAEGYFAICLAMGKDDLVAIGYRGLVQAIRDFDRTRGRFFMDFARICVHREILEAVSRNAERRRRLVIVGEPRENDRYTYDTIPILTESNGALKEISKRIEGEEARMHYFSVFLARLTPLEDRVLWLKYVESCSYLEIGAELDRGIKSIDNALRRIRAKMIKTAYEQDHKQLLEWLLTPAQANH